MADKPDANQIVALPVGGTAMLEIACNLAFTSFAGNTGNVACPNATLQRQTGPYHTSFDASIYDPAGLSGCALGIADVSDVNDVTMENLAIFSTNQTCVAVRDTHFEVSFQLYPRL